MLEIWGRKNSINVMTVMWTVGELGLEHERHDLGGSFGGLDADEYLALNPNCKVPTIRDGARVLWESQAIVRYLSSEYGAGTLWPADPYERAIADQWMEWAKVHVAPAVIYKVFWQMIRTAAADRDHQQIADAEVELDGLMHIADDRLAQTEWLAGDAFSLADVSFGTLLYRYYNVTFRRADLPHLKRYYDSLCQRPGYAEHVMISFESLRVEGA